jgi:hypothetical protein
MGASRYSKHTSGEASKENDHRQTSYGSCDNYSSKLPAADPLNSKEKSIRDYVDSLDQAFPAQATPKLTANLEPGAVTKVRCQVT